jgi:hypothetical protein
MYAVLIYHTKGSDLTGHEVERVNFTTLSAAEEAAEKAQHEGKDAIVLHIIRQPYRFTVGPDGIIRDIEWC